MKIIKYFEDKSCFERYHNNDPRVTDSSYKMKGHWYWGLNSDGNLCYHSSVHCRENEWILFNTPSNGKLGALLTLKDMKKIVKEFGHLLVFI